MNSILLNKHLLHRAGFGVDLKDISRIKNSSPQEIWKELLKKSEKYSPIKINLEDFSAYKPKEANAEMKKFFQKKNKEENAEIILNWYQNMISGEAQLREKMTFFLDRNFCYKKCSKQVQSSAPKYHQRKRIG